MALLREVLHYYHRPAPVPLDRRGPLRVMFVTTSLPVGGAETLQVNLMRRLDRNWIRPEFCCLKEFGPLGEELIREFSGFRYMLSHKWDLRVLPNLIRLFGRRRVDAVVTVGAGDKMFWGRLAAKLAGTPVILSALHSTGWPDTVGFLNRQLTPLTDAFIAVAPEHARHLVLQEGFPLGKVRMVPNGVDPVRFQPSSVAGAQIRHELQVPSDAPLVGIVAALRPEKNVKLLIRAFGSVRRQFPAAHLVVVGDGPERSQLEIQAAQGVDARFIHFLGARRDVPDVLNAFDVFTLSSRMEANPVSILEAMACGKPVVAPHVGSIPDTVHHGQTGRLVEPNSEAELASQLIHVLSDLPAARFMGQQGRQVVLDGWTLDHMVRGYTDLIREIYQSKCDLQGGNPTANPCPRPATQVTMDEPDLVEV